MTFLVKIFHIDILKFHCFVALFQDNSILQHWNFYYYGKYVKKTPIMDKTVAIWLILALIQYTEIYK